MNGDWKHDIITEDQYNDLVKTGMAWEFYPDMPLTWEGCLKELEEDEQ